LEHLHIKAIFGRQKLTLVKIGSTNGGLSEF